MKKQSGSALTLIVIVVVVLLVIGAVVTVGGLFLFKDLFKNSKLLINNPLVSKFNSKVAETQCTYTDKNICKYMAGALNMKDYSIKMTNSMQGISTESLIETLGEDKSHMVSWENGKETYNTIKIGDTTYTKDYSDNKWFKQTAKTTETKSDYTVDIKEQFSNFEMPESSVVDDNLYKFIGKEPCGKLTCFKYEIGESSGTSKEYIWFDDKEYLTRKFRMEDEGATSTGEYSYENIKITAPSPVKELKEGEIPLPGGGVYSSEDQEKYRQELEKYQQEMEKYQKEMETEYNSPEDLNNEDVFEESYEGFRVE